MLDDFTGCQDCPKHETCRKPCPALERALPKLRRERELPPNWREQRGWFDALLGDLRMRRSSAAGDTARLRWVDGLSQAEIARDLGVGQSTVSRRLGAFRDAARGLGVDLGA